MIEIINYKTTVDNIYIPSLLILRESKSILRTLELIKNPYDLLLIDAHGILHPRQCGMACYIGIIVDKPTIGIAKKLLCGRILKDDYVEYDGQILGYRIKKLNKKEIFVSIGHKISLLTAITIIKELIRNNERLPEPLRLADIYSKKYKKINLWYFLYPNNNALIKFLIKIWINSSNISNLRKITMIFLSLFLYYFDSIL